MPFSKDWRHLSEVFHKTSERKPLSLCLHLIFFKAFERRQILAVCAALARRLLLPSPPPRRNGLPLSIPGHREESITPASATDARKAFFIFSMASEVRTRGGGDDLLPRKCGNLEMSSPTRETRAPSKPPFPIHAFSEKALKTRARSSFI